MYTKNAELKAGIVVLLALAVLLTFLWYAAGAGALFARTREIYVRFEQGYAAPKAGDAVQMNGIEIGTVREVRQKEEIRKGAQLTPKDRASLKLKPGEDGVAREIYVLAIVRMPESQRIPDGTTAEISVDVTGARSLSLKPGLSPHDLSDKDTYVHPIVATSAGGVADVARSVQALVDKVGGLVEHGDLVLDDVREAIASVKRQVDRIDLEPIQRNLTVGSEDLAKALALARARADEILGKVSDAASSVKGVAGDAQALVRSLQGDVQKLLATLQDVADHLQGIVVRAGPRVEAMLDDLAKAGRSVAAAGEDLASLPPRLKAIVDKAGGDLDRALSRFAEVGHNLADASEDLRAHPWLLLNKPEEKEIAYENLRDAMRNLVRSAERVQEATEDLKLLEARSDVSGPERQKLVDDALERLRGDLRRYDETVQVLLELLKTAMPAGRPR